MKIFFYFLREFDELPICRRISKQMNIEFDYTTEYPTLENSILAKGFDAVSTTPCDMGAAMLERFHELGVKYIGTRSIGYDHIDMKRAKELGMRLSHVTYPADGVADFTIMLMLMALRKMPHIMKRSDVQDYGLRGKMGHDLNTCTVGIVGLGSIGCAVAKRLEGFGCRILGTSRTVKEIPGIEYTDFDTLLAESDIITLHMDSNSTNYHMIDKASIRKMKSGSILVNTARGRLIDTDALIEALESGHIKAAALDLMENENGLYYYDRMGDVIDNHQMAILRSFPNVILSPHVAFYTEENVEWMVRGAFESVAAFEAGNPTDLEVGI